MSNANQAWNLESFVDALVVELDKTRETLALKAINKPLSYSVKDMSLDLQIFPTFNGDDVQFTTAGAGEQGASTLAIQLASITDRQVRETSKRPQGKEDITLDQIDIDEQTQRDLRKIGVTSVSDLEQINEKNVDLDPVTRSEVNYADLANKIQQRRRDRRPPKVRSARLSKQKPGVISLTLEGDDLAPDRYFTPVATINGRVMEYVAHQKGELSFSCTESDLQNGENEMVIVTDPYSIAKIKVQNPE